MTATPLEHHDDDVLEVRNPRAPLQIVRIGPSATQLMGFGPTAEVVAWVSEVLEVPTRVLSAESLDEAADVHDEVLGRSMESVDEELERLEARAVDLEDGIARFDENMRAATGDGGFPSGVREANAAIALATTWEQHDDEVEAPAVDRVMQAHFDVATAQAVLAGASRSQRKRCAAALDAAIAAEAAALAAAGVDSYTQYLATALGAPGGHGPAVQSPDDRDADLRARAAQLLHRTPGADPVGELRAFAAERLDAVMHRPDPELRTSMVAELAAIDRRGRALVDALAHADCVARELRPSAWAAIAVGTGSQLMLVDGDVLDAVVPTVRDALLSELRTAAKRRRVVLASDDVFLDAWLTTVPQSMLWTSGHVSVVLAEGRQAPAPAEIPMFSTPAEVFHEDRVAMCVGHPGSATRLNCAACGRPYCSLCLVTVDQRSALVCVDCALERSGVRVGSKRSKRRRT